MSAGSRAQNDARRAREILGRSVTEKQFQRTVLELAEALGWSTYYTYDSRHSAPGFPDLVMVKSPRLLIIELKTETGGLSAAQAEWIDFLERCPGIEVYVWRPGNLPWIEAMLRLEDVRTSEYGGLAPQVESASPNTQTSDRGRRDPGARSTGSGTVNLSLCALVAAVSHMPGGER